MSDFILGQRWVVDSEPELGLGIVVETLARTVTIFFPLGDCERQYAIAQAPLTRIIFAEGDRILLPDGEQQVQAVYEQDGLITYDLGDGRLAPETQVSAEIQLNQPFTRLLMAQLDNAAWFSFRRHLDAAMAKVWSSRLNGLLGVRANLIAHQLYVAHQACDREHVRVLLADEVGLGKTIEAGMIINRLLKLERVSRVLIIIPDALQVQWLVELVRRFHLTPTICDEQDHDFNYGQIHLLPESKLASHYESALNAGFDLAVVDEAHHLCPGTDAFAALENIAAHTAHMILMTATPEQLGFEGHFARLRLLDPAKFNSAECLREQEQGYQELNTLIKALPDSRAALVNRFSLDATLSDDELTAQVLDTHGVGRVMFRNARAAVAGFPSRKAVPHTLSEDSWQARYEVLANLLKSESREKVLVICHKKENVIDCENYLWRKHGIDSALFHEDMSLIERDKAAAYFADTEMGARVLLCSEIGSEGRNFQFSHHLFCLDLPDHPDLLEQRIGRLDRIGQKNTVHIHAAFVPGEESEQQWQWYNKVLDCIATQRSAAGAVHEKYWPGEAAKLSPELCAQAAEELLRLEREIKDGRDALLEMNSCREPLASELKQRIATFEQDTPLALVEQASELLNFHFEALGGGRYSLIPADNMLISMLPGIPLDGVDLTFDRELACTREELFFMTWDSPFITGLWELLHHSELGSACVALFPGRQLPPGKCLIEACFDLVIQSPRANDCLPFLDQQSVRTLVIEGGAKNLAAVLPEDKLEPSLMTPDKKLARNIIRSQKSLLPLWFENTEGLALQEKDTLVSQALKKVDAYFNQEKGRLERLVQINPSVDNSDISALDDKHNAIRSALVSNVKLHLSAVRLIVTSEPANQ